jgi:hypothetical protein
MKSLDQILGEAVTKMKPSQLRSYRGKTQGGEPIETLISIAESCLKEGGEDARESGRQSIRRNNSGSYVDESGGGSEAESEAMLLEGLRRVRPQAFANSVEATEAARLTPQQRRDYEFCKMLNMSESDALKVASSGAIRD